MRILTQPTQNTQQPQQGGFQQQQPNKNMWSVVKQQPKKGWLESASDFFSKNIGGFGIGVAKGIMSLPSEAASLGQDIGKKAATAFRDTKGMEAASGFQRPQQQPTPQPQMSTQQPPKPSIASDILSGIKAGTEKTTEQFAPKTGAEKVGFTTEKVGEFFVPGLGEEAAAGATAKAGSIAEKLPFMEGVTAKAEELAKAYPKIAKFAKGAIELGAKSFSQAMDMGARTALQEGKIDAKTTSAAEIGAAMPFLAEGLGLLKNQLPKLSRALERVNLRLTPAQKRMMGEKIDGVVDYLSKEKIVGTAESRYQQVAEKTNEMEPKLESFLRSPEAVARPVPKQQILDDLEALKAQYQNRVDTDVLESHIDKVKALIESKQPEEVSLEALQQLKRSAYQSAYNEAGNKVLDDTFHDIGDVFRTTIESQTEGMTVGGKSIAEFNREYGTLLNAKKLLKTAASRKDVGFLAKLISSFIGGTLGKAGGMIGEAAGASIGGGAAELIAGTPTRSAISAGLQTIAEKGLPQATQPLVSGVSSQVIQSQGQPPVQTKKRPRMLSRPISSP